MNKNNCYSYERNISVFWFRISASFCGCNCLPMYKIKFAYHYENKQPYRDKMNL